MLKGAASSCDILGQNWEVVATMAVITVCFRPLFMVL